ncbi:glutamate receptor ionotropic, kainate 1-like, partial [Convolutriloba macropyga]|uniref:glutamate receptor ionotropic, kainate 1-like n=1 Tax=Convolutriloba macropyga TaxID=536237 RepID=UPI003F527E06
MLYKSIFALFFVYHAASVYPKTVTIGTVAYKTDSVGYTPLLSISSVWNTHVASSYSSFTFQLVHETVDYKDRDNLYQHYKAVCNLMTKGVRFLVPPSSPIGQEVFYSLSNEYHLPSLSPFYIKNSQHNPFSLSMVTNDYLMLFDFIANKNPDRVAFILQYNYDTELILYELERTLLPHIVIYYSSVTAAGDCEALFRQVEDALAYEVVIVGDLSTTKQIIKNAKSRQMMSNHYTFYLMNPEVNVSNLGLDRVPAKVIVGPMQSHIENCEVGQKARERDIILFSSHPHRDAMTFKRESDDVLREEWKRETLLSLDILTLLNLTLNKFEQENINESDYSKHKSAWLDDSSMSCDNINNDFIQPTWPAKKQQSEQWQYGQKLMRTIKEVDFLGFSGYVRFKTHNERFVNSSLWQYKGYEKLHQVASWNEQSKLTASEKLDKKLIPDKLRHFKITSILEKPFTQHVLDNNGRKTDALEGYCVDLIQELSARIGFSYELYIVPDGKYGSKGDKGISWNGMIWEVVSGSADMAAAPLTISAERQKWVDFTKPFMTSGISIMIKKPEKESPSIFSFLRPFKADIWYLTIAAYACVSTMLFVIAYFDPFERRDHSAEGPGGYHSGTMTTMTTELNQSAVPGATEATYEGGELEGQGGGATIANAREQVGYLSSLKEMGLLNSLWFAMSSILNQGSDMLPQSIAGRVVAGSWWFFTLFIVSAYTANLAAFLTFERLESPINSATDLAQQSRIKYGCVKDGTTMNFFK